MNITQQVEARLAAARLAAIREIITKAEKDLRLAQWGANDRRVYLSDRTTHEAYSVHSLAGLRRLQAEMDAHPEDYPQFAAPASEAEVDRLVGEARCPTHYE